VKRVIEYVESLRRDDVAEPYMVCALFGLPIPDYAYHSKVLFLRRVLRSKRLRDGVAVGSAYFVLETITALQRYESWLESREST